MQIEPNSQPNKLAEENESLKKQLQELENRLKNREEVRKKFTWWISKSISVLGLIYLIIALFTPANTRVNKVENPEIFIFIFSAILLINSGLIDKLENFSVDGTKIQANFQRLEKKQDRQQDEIKKLNQNQEIALKFSLKGIIDEHEFEHLNGLIEAEDNESEYIVKYGGYIESFEREIRHLIAVTFLYKKESITALINELRTSKKSDLRKYVKVTVDGRRYLSLRKELGIEAPKAERLVSSKKENDEQA